MSNVTLYHGDCLVEMAKVVDGSVDLILCDLPYGTTACKWDTIIPFAPLWAHYKRIIKQRGAIVLTASQPFTSVLVMSNVRWFKYAWTWDKVNGIRNHLNAKRQPMRQVEDVVVFYDSQPTFNPQMRSGGYVSRKTKPGQSEGFGKVSRVDIGRRIDALYPTNLLAIPSHNPNGSLHPTQKPVALMEYLIRTYTNPGETVMDNCFGSGTTGVAAVNTGRRFIGIEKDEGYFRAGEARIAAAQRAREEMLIPA
jgi:site-specific DNA-methyltransferase (adenine-specific)